MDDTVWLRACDVDQTAIRTLKARLTEAEQTIEQIRELHRPFHIYSECDHEHKAGDPGVVAIDDIGLTCAFKYDICTPCCTDDEFQTETCISDHDHGKDKPICATAEILGSKKDVA